MRLAELGHVDPDQRLLGREQPLRERLDQLGLADAGRAEEQEGAERAVALGEADAGAADRVRDDLDGVVLADDALVQVGLELVQALQLAGHQLAHRDAGAGGDDRGDLGLADLQRTSLASICFFSPAARSKSSSAIAFSSSGRRFAPPASRSFAAAWSTRSMALSGRWYSLM